MSTTINLAERFRSGIHGFDPFKERNRSFAIMSAAEFRTLVDSTSFPPDIAKATDYNLAAARGGRVAPRVNVIDSATLTVAVSVESSRTAAAAPTAYNSALPEGAISWTDSDEAAKRIGAWIPVQKGAWSDGSAEPMIRQLLHDDVLRALDTQILVGDATGENLLGLLDAGTALPTQALSTDSQATAIAKAVCTIRGAGHVGPVDVVVAAADAQDLVLSTDWQARERSLAALGFRDIVISPVLSAGKSLVGDFHAGAHLYVRADVEVSVSASHASLFTSSTLAVACETRVGFKAVREDAFVVITGF
jgi:hypothetical protein